MGSSTPFGNARGEQLRRFALLLCLVSAPLVPGRATAAESDSGGPVMCAWMIYSTLLHAGEKCRSDGDAAYLAWFRSQVERVNAFILRNSDIGEARLKQMDSKMNDVSKLSCEETGEILRAYERVRNLDREKLQADFDALLKIDRPPVMNPCL